MTLARGPADIVLEVASKVTGMPLEDVSAFWMSDTNIPGYDFEEIVDQVEEDAEVDFSAEEREGFRTLDDIVAAVERAGDE